MPAASPNIHKRLLAITEDAEVAKGGTAPGSVGGFAFHKIDDVEAVLKPLFVKHGVTALPTVAECDISSNGSWNHVTVKVNLEFTNADKPDDVIVVTSYGQGFDKQDKGIGKAISYATKNAYLSMFHLKGQPDNETDAGDDHVPAQDKPDPGVYVGFGKNAEKRWDQLSAKQLAWYAENANDESTRKIAAKHLATRESDIEEILPPEPELF